MNSFKLTRSQAAPFLKVFPDFKGRRIFANIHDRITFYNLNWCEGSKNYYRLVRLDGQTADPGFDHRGPWSQPMEGATVELDPTIAVVERSFHGMHEAIYIHVSSKELLSLTHTPKLLAAE